MFSRMGSAAFKKDLDNIILLCEHLGNPHLEFKSVHIAGTNGKGSVSHMMAAVFQSAGYTTGLYTSPHLYDFRERIRINGLMVEEEFVVDFVERIKPLIEKIQPSFFEITVAMAFEYFAMEEVDIAIIETGLGGRLDSTNIITPELSIITNIGWDHMNLLGNTLEEIAIEKAGIIKEDIPVLVGEWSEETAPVFERIALSRDADLFFAEDYFEPVSYKWENNFLIVDIADREENRIRSYTLDLPGIYQVKNICTVLQALELLWEDGFLFTDEAIESGLKNVKGLTGLQGRWDIIHNSPTVILEVAHNKEGISCMLEHIEQTPHEKLHIIYGMVRDKDAGSVLKLLPTSARYYFTQAHLPRALEAHLLKQLAAGYGLEGDEYENVNQALREALQKASANDLIIICGSIFVVAEVDKASIAQFT